MNVIFFVMVFFLTGVAVKDIFALHLLMFYQKALQIAREIAFA